MFGISIKGQLDKQQQVLEDLATEIIKLDQRINALVNGRDCSCESPEVPIVPVSREQIADFEITFIDQTEKILARLDNLVALLRQGE